MEKQEEEERREEKRRGKGGGLNLKVPQEKNTHKYIKTF